MSVMRAEDFYTPPPRLPPTAWDALPAAERVISWYEEAAQRRLPRPTTELDGDLYARIDAGRWVAQCPCGSAQVVSPADPRMLCVGCLDGWRRLILPADVEATEQAVGALPVRERCWWHEDDPGAPGSESEGV